MIALSGSVTGSPDRCSLLHGERVHGTRQDAGYGQMGYAPCLSTRMVQIVNDTLWINAEAKPDSNQTLRLSARCISYAHRKTVSVRELRSMPMLDRETGGSSDRQGDE